MAVYEGSRYIGSATLFRVTDTKGVTRPTVYQNRRWLQNSSVNFKNYTVKEGDRLDKLSYALYGTSEYWWAIARLNPTLLYQENLTPGLIIRVPA